MATLFKGAEKHQKGVSNQWLEELRKTRQVKNWQQDLLNRVNARLKNFQGSLERIGRNIGDIQLQFDTPIKHVQEFVSRVNEKLSVAWVTFYVWNPITKTEGERTLRFGPDTAALMVLVRSPKTTGDGYNWFLLARSKYQLAIQNKFVEFSRGWDISTREGDAAWYLLDRDFPGLRDWETSAINATSIKHLPLGGSVHENTAEFMNDTSDHLIVVTLSEPMDIETLRSELITAKVEQEYGNREEYPDTSELGPEDLFSLPMVFKLEDAAKYLNANVTSEGTEKGSMFRETFSMRCWDRFLTMFGDEFPEVKPQITPLSELL